MLRVSALLAAAAIAALCYAGCESDARTPNASDGVETKVSEVNGVRTMTKSSWYIAPDGKCAYTQVKTYVEKDGNWIEVKP